MNEKTLKLLASYAKESGRTRKDIKDWWRSLVEEDKARARKNMMVLVTERRKDRKDRAEKLANKKK